MKSRISSLQIITHRAFVIVHYCDLLSKMDKNFPSILWQNTAFDIAAEHYRNEEA